MRKFISFSLDKWKNANLQYQHNTNNKLCTTQYFEFLRPTIAKLEQNWSFKIWKFKQYQYQYNFWDLCQKRAKILVPIILSNNMFMSELGVLVRGLLLLPEWIYHVMNIYLIVSLLFRYQTDVGVILSSNGSWWNELLNKFVWLIDRWSRPGPWISRDQSTWYHHNHLHFTNPWGHDSHYHHR